MRKDPSREPLSSAVPVAESDAIHEARATIWIEDGIIYCRDDPGIEISGEIARERLVVYDRLAAGRPLPLLCEVGEGATVAPEGRKILLGPEATRRAPAIAVVVRSVAARLSVNAYFALFRPRTPMKMFSDRTKARRWLRSVVAG